MDPAQIQTPTSPLGSFPEIAAMYRSSFQAPVASGQIGATDYNAKVDIANQEAAQQAEKEKQKVLSDPSNYRVIPRNDGGYGFYDPTGKEISAADYASVTGKTPQEVLKNSQNPIDIGFHKDFKDLQDYINNKLQSKTNVKSAAAAKNVEQQVQKTYGVDISNYKPDQLIQQFQHAYPTVYGLKNTGVPSGQVFIPQSNI